MPTTSAPRTSAAALAGFPAEQTGHPSPVSWQDEVLYLVVTDRFSDTDDTRPLLDRSNLDGARLAPFNLEQWAESGSTRFQGGTLRGVTSRLGYLRELGVTTIWLGPVWKQRSERDDYHGYAVQDFLNVDPRFGTREDLVELVASAHRSEIRVVLDIIVNHTGENWLYAAQEGDGAASPPQYRDVTAGPYSFGGWLNGSGTVLPDGSDLTDPDAGVWPAGPLQQPDAYHRAGAGSYGDGDVSQWPSAFAEFRRADWNNRDLALTDGPLGTAVLEELIDCWTYWMRVTDCDGFRIDTFKHIRIEEGRRLCGAIREQAETIGKDNFLLVAEVGGGDVIAEDFLTLQAGNLSAVLEIGETRQMLRKVAAGEESPFPLFDRWPSSAPTPPSPTSEMLPSMSVKSGTPFVLPSHRSLGDRFVYTIDDHDNLWLRPRRFATEHPGRTVPAVALLLLTLGIPCLYYGTEQDLGLPVDLLAQLPHVDDAAQGGDRYIREAMFGPDHPRRPGRDGSPGAASPLDPSLPGFGPFATSGSHVFNPESPTFRRVQALLRVRADQLPLRRGRQYLREIRYHSGEPFAFPPAGGLVAWSRILADTEVVCVVNLSDAVTLTAEVRVDAELNLAGPTALRVLLDTGRLAASGADPVVAEAAVWAAAGTQDGRRYVQLPSLAPTEVLVLSNRPRP